MNIYRIIASVIALLMMAGFGQRVLAEGPSNAQGSNFGLLSQVQEIKGPSAVISTVRFGGPDGSLAAGFFNNQIQVWSSLGGPSVQLQGHENWVTAVAWCPQQPLLVSAGLDKKIFLWQPPTNKPLLTLPGHDQWIRALAVGAQGRRLASGGDDNLVKIWDLPASFPSPLQTEATGDAGGQARLRFTLPGHTDWVMALAFNPHTDVLASGSLDGTVRLWHSSDGKASYAFTPQPLSTAADASRRSGASAVLALAFDPYGLVIAAGGADRTIRLWDVQNGKLLGTLQGHADQVLGLAFHPGGRMLASASADGTVRLWDVLTGQPLQVRREHNQWVYGVDFSADGRLLASAGADETIRIWSLGE